MSLNSDRGMAKLEMVPVSFEPFARQMFEAVTEACRLPEGEIRDRLLRELTSAMSAAAHPQVMLRDE